jgi:hypothetical protein
MGKGTSTTTQNTSSSLAAYDPAKPALDGILGKITGIANGAGSLNSNQSNAIDQLVKNGQNGNPFAGGIAGAAYGLLNGGGATDNNAGVTGNFNDYKGLLADTASGKNIGANSDLKAQLDQITTDATNQVNGAWAAAGRDGSPGNFQALGRGIASGVAPVLAAQYNTDKDRQLGAAKSIYDAGNSTYGILNSRTDAANNNIVNGVNVAGSAWDASNSGANAVLDAEAKRFGIPTAQLVTLLGAVSPAAAQFGTQTGTGTGTQTMSDADLYGKMLKNVAGAGTLLFG